VVAFFIDGDGADEKQRSGFDKHRDSDAKDVAHRATGRSAAEAERFATSESRALPPPPPIFINQIN